MLLGRGATIRIGGVLVSAVGIAASLTVSVATAAAPAARGADVCGPPSFSAVERLVAAPEAAVVREPELGRGSEARARPDRSRGFEETVPVWFHVVHHADGTGNVPTKAVWHQLYVLNGSYKGYEGGTNGGFTFTMGGITRTGNTTWYNAGPGSGAERQMKTALKVGGDNTLNVYLTTAGQYLGWAYFPDITDDPNNRVLDGVVVDWESMLGTSTRYLGQYDQGETLPHEAGHWLNLYHTFDGGCSEPGDHVADTPPQASPTSGCPIGRDSCAGGGVDPIHNYMDYSYDTCYTEFTPGQVARMQAAWIQWRES